MSNESRMPLATLLAWLKEKPRTLGWNAILAYDSDKTNRVLRHEYIERFDSGSYLPPYEELIPTTDFKAEFLYNYTFDAPRLSFVDATIAKSRATVRQTVIGGVQLSLHVPVGLTRTQVEKIFHMDALDGPSLESDVALRESTGHVNLAGKVILDIAEGVNPRLVFSGTEEEREILGKHFLRRFGDLREEQRRVVLNEIPLGSDTSFRPKDFLIRTQPAPGNRVRGSQDYGKGAVLVFISMQGETGGRLPEDDKDLPWLIPDDHSATLLLGHDFMARRIYLEGCENMINPLWEYAVEVTYDSQAFLRNVKIAKGRASKGRIYGTSPTYEQLRIEDLTVHLGGNGAFFSLDIESERLVWYSRGFGELPMALKPNNEPYYTGDVWTVWLMNKTFKFEVDPEAGNVSLNLVAQGSDQYVVEKGDFAGQPPIASRFEEVAEFAERYGRWALGESLKGFLKPAESIDIFRLSGLLFKGRNTVVLKSAHLPGDMLLVGDVSPTRAEFAIDPLEPVLGPDAKLQFSTLPPRSGVSWTVEHLPGGTGPVGNISQSGIYNAPKGSEIKGGYLRLRVRARVGQFVSTALVTVLDRDVTVNPLVQICGPNNRRPMSAGTLGGDAVWSIATPGSGASIVPSTDPDGDHTYIAGPPTPEQPFRIDEVRVRNAHSGVQGSAYVVVSTGVSILELAYEQTASPDSVQCKAYFASNGLPVELPLQWRVMFGSGRIDATGLFSIDPDGEYPFAVVSCKVLMTPAPPGLEAVCLMPSPLVPLPDLVKTMQRAASLLGSSATS